MKSSRAHAVIAPLDASLALAIRARRCARQSLTHLLPSAPLLGRPVRRLVRLLGTSVDPDALYWRARARSGARREEGGGRGAVAVRDRWHVLRERVAPAPGPPTIVRRETRTQSVGPREAVSSGAAHPLFASVEPVAERDDARGLATIPSLVWFARWRELRVQRHVQSMRAMSPSLVVRRATPGALLPSTRNAVRQQQFPLGALREQSTRAAPTQPPQSRDGATRPLSAPVADVGPGQEPTPTRIVSLTSASMPRSAEWASLLGVVRRANAPHETRSRSTSHRNSDEGQVFRYPETNPPRRDASESNPGIVTSPGPAAIAATLAVDVVQRALSGQIATHVENTVKQSVREHTGSRALELPSPVQRLQVPGSKSAAQLAPPLRIDDRTVTALLTRIRSLERREHFRHGYLR